MTVTTTELSALTGTWTLDPAHTRIGFSAKHAMVATVRGAFGVFDGTLVLDGDEPGQQHRAGLDRRRERRHRQRHRDAHVRSADFLDVESLPDALLRAPREVRIDGDDFELVGDLTVKDVTRSVDDRRRDRGHRRRPVGQHARRVLRRDHDQPQGLRPDLERRPRGRRHPGRRQDQDHPRRQRRQAGLT